MTTNSSSVEVLTPVNSSYGISAVSIYTTSDYRIKKNVNGLNDDYIVDNLNPVTYNNILLNDKQDIGLIAHELQEYYPFLVNGNKDDIDYQNVNYIGIIGILIKEVKKLKEEIKLIKEKLNF